MAPVEPVPLVITVSGLQLSRGPLVMVVAVMSFLLAVIVEDSSTDMPVALALWESLSTVTWIMLPSHITSFDPPFTEIPAAEAFFLMIPMRQVRNANIRHCTQCS